MSWALLLSLFAVAFLLSVRAPERVLALLLTALGLVAAGLLAYLAVQVGTDPAGWQSGRLTGPLTALGFVVGSGLVLMGRMLTPSLDRPSPLLSVPFRAVSQTNAGARRTASGTASRRSALNAPLTDVDFQEYDVLERIGIGGIGSVYKARRRIDGRIVALKVPQEKYLADAKFVKRFYREAEVLKRFNHPNIVRVYDYRMQDPEH